MILKFSQVHAKGISSKDELRGHNVSALWTLRSGDVYTGCLMLMQESCETNVQILP